MTVRVYDPDFFRRVTCYGNLGMGEAYMAASSTCSMTRCPPC